VVIRVQFPAKLFVFSKFFCVYKSLFQTSNKNEVLPHKNVFCTSKHENLTMDMTDEKHRRDREMPNTDTTHNPQHENITSFQINGLKS